MCAGCRFRPLHAPMILNNTVRSSSLWSVPTGSGVTFQQVTRWTASYGYASRWMGCRWESNLQQAGLKRSRVRTSPREIERGIDFLSTHIRDIPERHRSIRAVFDHSWYLLTEDEQAVFPRLAVFRGEYAWEAAAKVAAADLRTLAGLVEKSIVRQDARGRYDLHELLRQYAQEKLDLAGETEAAVSAHSAYFAAFTHARSLDIKGRRQVEGLDAIEEDFDNIAEAWVHAVDHVDYEALDPMSETFVIYCDLRRHQEAGEALLYHAQNHF